MTDADKAYQIAEERIELAKRSGARILALSPMMEGDGEFTFQPTAELRALRRLPDSIAELTELQTLHLLGTSV